MTDPYPAGTTELLEHGAERDPWRPSRAVALVTAALVVLAAAVTGAAAVVRHEHGLDARAAAQVSLQVGTVEGEQEDGLHLQLLNATAQGVRLVDVRFDAPGYPERALATDLGPYAEADIVVPASSSCNPRLLSTSPRALVVRVRTRRGGIVSRTLPFEADTASSVGDLERSHCGLLSPDEAVRLDPFSVSTVGMAVLVKAYLNNTSNVAVTVEQLTAVPGLEVSAPLPLTVAGTVHNVSDPTLTTLRLTVLNCSLFARSFAVAPQDRQPDQLLASVRSAYGRATVRLDLTLGSMGGPNDPPAVAPLPYLIRQCPSQDFTRPTAG